MSKDKAFFKEILYRAGEIIESNFERLEDGEVLFAGVQLPHKGYFLKVPESVRRCYYLEPNEKQVLFELYSWADSKGIVKVTIDLIALKLGITEKTVRNTLKTLKEKGFILIDTEGRANIYTISTLKDNPYFVLSEFIHRFIEVSYYRKGIQTYHGEWAKKIGKKGVREWRKAIVYNVPKIAKQLDVYQKYIDRLRNNPADYLNIISEFEEVLLTAIASQKLPS
jgi:predicted transcriptional regulator